MRSIVRANTFVVVVRACLLNSHRWLHARLTEAASNSSKVIWTTDPDAADIVIYPVPPWHDSQAPQRLSAPRRHRWSRVFLFSQKDIPVLWAPGVFTSVPASHPHVASFRGGFYVSHSNYEPEHVAALEPRPHDETTFLWSFVGTVSTCPPVREPLVALKDVRAFTMDTEEWSRRHRWQTEGPGRADRSNALASYAEMLHRAKFVACPRGVGLSSFRLFEAMRVARCPVIVSDAWLPPPFVDWESCAMRVPEGRLHHLPDLLREREHEAVALGLRARAIWEQRYSPEAMLNTLVESCLDISPSELGASPRLRMMRRSAASRTTAREVKLRIRRVLKR